jgi:hypothetical protein
MHAMTCGDQESSPTPARRRATTGKLAPTDERRNTQLLIQHHRLIAVIGISYLPPRPSTVGAWRQSGGARNTADRKAADAAAVDQ